MTQELDETLYWMELIVDADVIAPGRLAELQAEAEELMKIFVTSIKTTKRR